MQRGRHLTLNDAASPRPVACNNLSLDLGSELQRIYDSEINVRISWLWDLGRLVCYPTRPWKLRISRSE